jgi:phosphohistidine phosphatase
VKTLYLLRHAKADPAARGAADIDRPLSSRGRDACVDMAAYMKKKRYVPACALSSPSARTRETLERICAASGFTIPERIIDKLYLAEADEIVHYVRLVSDAVDSVMVVGHNPGMHHAALMLSGPDQTRLRHMLELKYPTGTLCILRFAAAHWGDIAEGGGELVDFAVPQTQ